MNLFSVFAIVITLTALYSYVNEVYIKLPSTIGVMLASLISSISVIILGYVGYGHLNWARELVQAADFDHLVMNGMLSFLLFAGASRVNIDDLKEYKWTIAYLATIGMVIATAITGFAVWWALGLLHVDLPFVYALLFGAIISPIDAVVVLKLLKRVDAGHSLETVLTGESLFNDAVAVVLFVFLVKLASGEASLTSAHFGEYFIKEGLGGLALGLVLGFICMRMIIKIVKTRQDAHTVVALLTLALVSGGYALAEYLEVSGPLTSVVAGLFLAKRRHTMGTQAEHIRSYTETFWDVIDDVLNALLFVLIGLEVLVLDFESSFVLCCLLVIPLTIAARFISIELPMLFLRLFKLFPSMSSVVMTWSGLRGGVSVALALSLPASKERDLILIITYMVVVFSILVQGLTLDRVVKWHKSGKIA